MDTDFTLAADPDEIKEYLHGLGLIRLDEYFVQLRRMIQRQKQSPKTINEQVQRKLAENGIHTDESSRNMPLLFPRKRTSFSPVITRKRGKAIKKRTPSATQVVNPLPTVVKSEVQSSNNESVESPINTPSVTTMNDDQPLDLRLQSKSTNPC